MNLKQMSRAMTGCDGSNTQEALAMRHDPDSAAIVIMLRSLITVKA